MRKIALIMDEWKRCFTFAWPSGILHRIREVEEDVNLYIFSSSGNWSWDEEYNIGEYNIYQLPDLQEFDGIILDLNNVVMEDVRQATIDRAKASGVPVISLGCEIDGCYYVGIDNYHAMYEMIAHMHETHGCQSYWFVMGPRENYENAKRLEGLKAYMAEHRITYSDDDFYFGNFEYACGLEGFETLFQKHQKLPDAIICANDNIAVGVGEASLKHGFHIPDDFKMTGFDNFDKASIYHPNITTVSHVREDVGIRCADLFLQLWAGEKPQRLIHTVSKPLYWESCGCGNHARLDVRKNLKDHMMYDIQTQEFQEMVLLLEYELQSCQSIPDIMDCIAKFVSSFQCDAMYLVMDERIHTYKRQAKVNEKQDLSQGTEFVQNGYPSKMQIQFAYENGKRLNEIEMTTIEGIFPTFDFDRSRQDFLFLPLHFGKDTIGYFVIRNAVYLLEQQYLFDVMGVLTKAIENFHKKEKLQYMNDLLSKLYVHDAVTGLYNRMGYMKFGNDFLLEKHRKGQKVTVYFIDLDRLKEINDEFGHEFGDFAIIAVARAMERCSERGAFIARIGGDEYVLLQQTLDAEKEEQFKCDIRRELSDKARQTEFPMPLTISIGSVVTNPTKNDSLEEYVRLADEKMYEEKVAKKANRK